MQRAVTLDKLYTFQVTKRDIFIPTFLSFCFLCSTGIEISNITLSLKRKQQPPQSEIMHHSMHTFIHF